DRVDQFVHASGQSDEQTPARAATAFWAPPTSLLVENHRQRNAASATFHLFEARHGSGEAKLIRVRCIDATDEWLRHPFQRFDAKAPTHEGAQAFISSGRSAGQQDLRRHSELAA